MCGAINRTCYRLNIISTQSVDSLRRKHHKLSLTVKPPLRHQPASLSCPWLCAPFGQPAQFETSPVPPLLFTDFGASVFHQSHPHFQDMLKQCNPQQCISQILISSSLEHRFVWFYFPAVFKNNGLFLSSAQVKF